MRDTTGKLFRALGGRMTLAAFLAGLLFMSYQVLHLFLVPVTWALILVYVTWPLHRWLRSLLSPYGGLSAFLMTVILALVFVLPLLWAVALLRAEVPAGYANLVGLINQGPEVLPPRWRGCPGSDPSWSACCRSRSRILPPCASKCCTGFGPCRKTHSR